MNENIVQLTKEEIEFIRQEEWNENVEERYKQIIETLQDDATTNNNLEIQSN